jgi:hypothetical protein
MRAPLSDPTTRSCIAVHGSSRWRIQCDSNSPLPERRCHEHEYGAAFYDPIGALRDVVQNHLLQLIGLFASEPPTIADSDVLRDKRVEVFRAIPAADPNPGADLVVQAEEPRAQSTRTADLSLLFSEELVTRLNPTSGSPATPCTATPAFFTREESIEETWRIVQPSSSRHRPQRPQTEQVVLHEPRSPPYDADYRSYSSKRAPAPRRESLATAAGPCARFEAGTPEDGGPVAGHVPNAKEPGWR